MTRPLNMPLYYRFTDGVHVLRMLPARDDEANSFYQYLGRHYIRDASGMTPRFSQLTCLDYTFSQTGVCPICAEGVRVRQRHGSAAAIRFQPKQRALMNVVDMQMSPRLGVQIAELVPSVMSAMLQYIDRQSRIAILSPKLGKCLEISKSRTTQVLSVRWETQIHDPEESEDLSKLMRYRYNLRNEILQNSEQEYQRAIESLRADGGLNAQAHLTPVYNDPPLILTPDEITQRLSSRRKLVL